MATKPISPVTMATGYETNKDFKDYIDKYCKTYRIDKETAFSHLLVKEVWKMYNKE